jgi:hypothetical protein
MMVKTLVQDDFFEIDYDDEYCCLHVDWKGYQTDKSVKDGVNCFINLMSEHQVFKVLNDNTNILGIWMGVAGWLVFDALPRAKKAGMTSFAHVYGTSRFSRVSADAAIALLHSARTDIKAFENLQAAKDWLRSRP